ncbi:MAG: aldehyde ferredoxin oxidoreductase, partial [Deltaproteobacteria bacterium]|nr:aldehyde ferredoxin oxidoreductase [Deltaproteobacteria bacterium]
ECLRVVKEIHETDGVIDPENEIYTDGTPILVDFCQESGLLPTANFQEGTFDSFENVNTAAMKEIRQAKKACYSCAIACGNYLKGKQHEVEGPEYETIALCGPNLRNDSKDRIVEINALCDDLGLDTISTGSVLAYMMEMTEKGLYDFGIRFGDTEKAVNIVRHIAFKEGLGAEAAMGVRALSEKYGGQEMAMHVKGMELPGYDPRGSWGMGISYATAPRGGCHMTAYAIEAEAWGDLDPFTYEGKAKLVCDLQNAQFAKFSMGVCDFWPISSETLARLYSVTFGGDWTGTEVDFIGERIFNLQRVFNVMAGFDHTDDRLPGRLHNENLKAGPPKDVPMPYESMTVSLDEYYQIRGWDSQGRPTPEKLKDLQIEDVFIDQYRAYIELS